MQRKDSALARPLVRGLLASLCCLLWGSAIPFINLGYRLFAIEGSATGSQILFAGTRFFLAGFVTVIIVSAMNRRAAVPKRESAGKVVKLALVQTVAQYVFFYIGVAHTQSVEGSIILGLGAFVSILVACYLFKSERMNALKWLGGLLGAAGIVAVNWTGAGAAGATGAAGAMSALGEGCLLVSMIASACSAGMIKRYGQEDDPAALSGWQFMLGGAAMAAAGWLSGGRLSPQGIGAWGALLYLAMLSATAYTLWAMLLQVNPVSSVAVYMFLQPIFGVLLSLLLFYDGSAVPYARYGAALALVCLSIAVVGRGQREGA